MVMVVVVVVKGVVPLHEVKKGDLVNVTLSHVSQGGPRCG